MHSHQCLQVNDDLLEVPEFPGSSRGCLWENSPVDRHVFAVYDEKNIYTYIYHQEHIKGWVVVILCCYCPSRCYVDHLLWIMSVNCQHFSGCCSITDTPISKADYDVTFRSSCCTDWHYKDSSQSGPSSSLQWRGEECLVYSL